MSMTDFLSVATPIRRGSSLLSIAARAAQVRRQRKALKRLTDAQLNDLGLTRAQAETEAQRPFWDAPVNWRL